MDLVRIVLEVEKSGSGRISLVSLRIKETGSLR